MFEPFIEEIKQKILEQVEPDKPHIYLFELINNINIDKAYKTFFSAEVDWWLYCEQQNRLQNPNFDMQDEKIQSLYSQLDMLLKKNARLKREDLEALIGAAVEARINIICRPRTTLKTFVFMNKQEIAAEEILKRLEYFDNFAYLINGLKKWTSDRAGDNPTSFNLTYDEFSEAVDSVDKNEIIDKNIEQILDVFDHLFSFFNPGEKVYDSTSVPIEALIIFFDDKGLYDFSRKLEEQYYDKGFKSISRQRLMSFIDEELNLFKKERDIVSEHPEIEEPAESVSEALPEVIEAPAIEANEEIAIQENTLPTDETESTAEAPEEDISFRESISQETDEQESEEILHYENEGDIIFKDDDLSEEILKEEFIWKEPEEMQKDEEYSAEAEEADEHKHSDENAHNDIEEISAEERDSAEKSIENDKSDFSK